MSEIARSGSSTTRRTRRTVAELAATTVLLIVFATALGARDLVPSKSPNPTRKPEGTRETTRELSNVSPDVAARTFVSSFVSFLYGRRAAAGVSPIGQGLYRQLLGARSIATPAELTRALIVHDLAVTVHTRVTATGSAVVDDGASPPYALSFNLSFSHQWLVTAVRSYGQ